MKRNTKITLYVGFALLMVAVIVLANVSRLNRNIRGVQVVISEEEASPLISAKALERRITANLPVLFSTPVKEVDLDAVERVVSSCPFVEECEVSVSVGAKVVVHAHPSVAIVRLFVGDKEFYLDRLGRHMPLSSEGSADVIVANGIFQDPLPTKMNSINAKYLERSAGHELALVWQLAHYLYQHPEYGVLFDQIYLADNDDLYLVPKVGQHVVLLGSNDDLDNKMFNLLAFYREGCNKVGWDTYSQISVKYGGQVICTKR